MQARSTNQAGSLPPNINSTTTSMDSLNLDEDVFANFEELDDLLIAGRYSFYMIYSGRVTGIFCNWWVW